MKQVDVKRGVMDSGIVETVMLVKMDRTDSSVPQASIITRWNWNECTSAVKYINGTKNHRINFQKLTKMVLVILTLYIFLELTKSCHYSPSRVHI